MALINFKKECGIPTFSRARKGWAKRITGLDKQHSNGYSFQGDFVNLGNFDTNLVDGIYLDCSKKADEDGDVIKTYHIFTCEDGKIKLLKTVEDGKGWAVQCWDVIDDYLNKDGITAQELMNQILEKTQDKEVLQRLIDEIQEEIYGVDEWASSNIFYNEYHQKGIMKQMCYQEYCEYTYKHFCRTLGENGKEEKTIYERLREKGEANVKIQKHHNDHLFAKDWEHIFNGFWIFDDKIDIEKVWNGEIPIIYRKIDRELLMNRGFIGRQASYNMQNCSRVCFYFDRITRTNNHNCKHTFMVRYNKEENIVEIEHFYHYRDDRWD